MAAPPSRSTRPLSAPVEEQQDRPGRAGARTGSRISHELRAILDYSDGWLLAVMDGATKGKMGMNGVKLVETRFADAERPS